MIKKFNLFNYHHIDNLDIYQFWLFLLMTRKINPKEFQEKKENYVIIDVRESDELKQGIIDGAINMPLGALIRKAKQGQINDLKGKKIITYCSGGYRGSIAADELNNQGFDAVTIDGGYYALMDKKNEK